MSVRHDEKQAVAAELYRALAAGDRKRLDEILDPAFEGRITEGLPLDLGGTYGGPDAMRREFWGRIARSYDAHAEPAGFRHLDDGDLLVTGRYVGVARQGGGKLDAEFFHVLSFEGKRITGLVQLTDSARWSEALGTARPLSTVDLRVTDGLAEVRLDRPHVRNALDQAMADDLYEVAQRLAADPEVRAVLIAGNGPVLTVGGDIAVFADNAGAGLPGKLRRMISPYHEALRILSRLDAPIVCAAHGAVAGGGLGLLYSADIVLAAEGTKFVSGFTALGLSGDGGNSWFLPRLVGPRRAAEFYLEQRVLDAHEAVEWGLATRVLPAAELADEALAVARRLAAGPTRAHGEIRRLLRESWSATLAEQLISESDAIARTAATSDASAAVTAFIDKRKPTFQGR
ncbi:enoyl-CoA hydratase-related protein [Streptomyces mirabilis]|uniref:enoyl-CoA hydratase-related protein n=1 Tax=Streptomyces mirabilis TaxID=68239 RepID=UPI00332E9DC5